MIGGAEGGKQERVAEQEGRAYQHEAHNGEQHQVAGRGASSYTPHLPLAELCRPCELFFEFSLFSFSILIFTL
jgi:hypothetical protein